MATHVNFAAILPCHNGTFDVCIVRGVDASGNGGAVVFEHIAHTDSINSAVTVAKAAPFIGKLDFWAYAPSREAPDASSANTPEEAA